MRISHNDIDHSLTLEASKKLRHTPPPPSPTIEETRSIKGSISLATKDMSPVDTTNPPGLSLHRQQTRPASSDSTTVISYPSSSSDTDSSVGTPNSNKTIVPWSNNVQQLDVLRGKNAHAKFTSLQNDWETFNPHTRGSLVKQFLDSMATNAPESLREEVASFILNKIDESKYLHAESETLFAAVFSNFHKWNHETNLQLEFLKKFTHHIDQSKSSKENLEQSVLSLSRNYHRSDNASVQDEAFKALKSDLVRHNTTTHTQLQILQNLAQSLPALESTGSQLQLFVHLQIKNLFENAAAAVGSILGSKIHEMTSEYHLDRWCAESTMAYALEGTSPLTTDQWQVAKACASSIKYLSKKPEIQHDLLNQLLNAAAQDSGNTRLNNEQCWELFSTLVSTANNMPEEFKKTLCDTLEKLPASSHPACGETLKTLATTLPDLQPEALQARMLNVVTQHLQNTSPGDLLQADILAGAIDAATELSCPPELKDTLTNLVFTNFEQSAAIWHPGITAGLINKLIDMSKTVPEVLPQVLGITQTLIAKLPTEDTPPPQPKHPLNTTRATVLMNLGNLLLPENIATQSLGKSHQFGQHAYQILKSELQRPIEKHALSIQERQQIFRALGSTVRALADSDTRLKLNQLEFQNSLDAFTPLSRLMVNTRLRSALTKIAIQDWSQKTAGQFSKLIDDITNR